MAIAAASTCPPEPADVGTASRETGYPVMVTKPSQISVEDLRQAAEYARAFADLVRLPETKYAFAQLAAKWDREAEELEAAARLRSLKDER